MELSIEQRQAVEKAIQFVFDIDNQENLFVINGNRKSGKTTIFNHLLSDLSKNIALYKSLNHTEYYIHSVDLQSLGITPYTPIDGRLLLKLLDYPASDLKRCIYLVDNASNLYIEILKSLDTNDKVILFTSNVQDTDIELNDCYSPFSDLIKQAQLDLSAHPMVTYLPKDVFNKQFREAIMNDPVNTIHVRDEHTLAPSMCYPEPQEGMLYQTNKNREERTFLTIRKLSKAGNHPALPEFKDYTVVEMSAHPNRPKYNYFIPLDASKTNEQAEILRNLGMYFTGEPYNTLTASELEGISYETIYLDSDNLSTDQLKMVLGAATKRVFIKRG